MQSGAQHLSMLTTVAALLAFQPTIPTTTRPSALPTYCIWVLYVAFGQTNALYFQVYCSGDNGNVPQLPTEGSRVFITGGSFIGNKALEVGGALMISGTPTTVTIMGGNFKNNYAT